MTLYEVALRCEPPTTPQTIGRLEKGVRNVSVGWLNRIAGALGVEAADLVSHPARLDLPVVALLDHVSARAPRQQGFAILPQPEAEMVAINVTAGVGDYRSGDEIWCRRIEPEDFSLGLNRDMLVPRHGGRFLFGRLIGREAGKLHLLPPGGGARQVVIAEPPWGAIAVKLIRNL